MNLFDATKRHFLSACFILGLPLILVTASPQMCHAQTSVAEAVKFRTVALSKTQAPGLPEGLTIGSGGGWPLSFAQPRVDANGNVAFVTGLYGKGLVKAFDHEEFSNDEALYVETEEGLRPLLRHGDAVLPNNDELKLNYIQPQFGGDGNLVVLARLTDKPRGDSSFAVFSSIGGAFRPIVKSGDEAVGAEGTLTAFEGVQNNPVNDAGIVTFLSTAKPSKKKGLWSGTPDQWELLALQGEQAPGMDEGTTIKYPGVFAQNSKGDVAFVAKCVSKDQKERPSGIWLAKAGESPKLLMSSNDPPNGILAGASIDSFERPIVLNDADQVAVYAMLSSDKFQEKPAILFHDAGKWSVVLRYGDEIAGVDSTVADAPAFVISQSGQLAVQVTSESKLGVILHLDPTLGIECENCLRRGLTGSRRRERCCFRKTRRARRIWFSGR